MTMLVKMYWKQENRNSAVFSEFTTLLFSRSSWGGWNLYEISAYRPGHGQQGEVLPGLGLDSPKDHKLGQDYHRYLAQQRCQNFP